MSDSSRPPSKDSARTSTVTGFITRHSAAWRWIACLVASALCWSSAPWLLELPHRADTSGPGIQVLWVIIVVIALLVSWLSPFLLVLGIVLLIRHIARIYTDHRRSRGHYTARERQEIMRRDDLQRSWDHARAVARDFMTDDPCSAFKPWDVLLDQDEAAFIDCPAGYSRFYGTTVSYTQAESAFFGSPAFVLAGMSATAISNSANRRAAQRLAADQWREHQQVRCLITEHRILLQRSDFQWLSFYFSGMVSVHPLPADGLFFAEFSDTSPLRLEGPAAVLASVVAVWKRFGTTGLRDHPGLEHLRLRPAQPAPSATSRRSDNSS